MLRILEAEEEAENHREKLIISVPDPTERRRLEKILGAERAKA
jgi:hypothetical protein